jgi:hypothetical protein
MEPVMAQDPKPPIPDLEDDRRMPMALRLVAGFLVFLAAWELLAIVELVSEGNPDIQLVRSIVIGAAAAAAAWCVLSKVAWGYVLGLLVSLYWLSVAARMLPYVGPNNDITFTIGAIVYFTFGGLLLTGLLMPSSRAWFLAAWRRLQQGRRLAGLR